MKNSKQESRRIRNASNSKSAVNTTSGINRGVTSAVHINISNGTVIKHVTRYHPQQVFEREVYWLTYLNEKGYSWCPKLVGFDAAKKTICMQYVGIPITRQNAPQDWKEQLQRILADLKKENIRHNDIKRTEVLVKAGQLFLIDYGWTSRGNDWSCGQGFDARVKPCHNYHDQAAMHRISQHL